MPVSYWIDSTPDTDYPPLDGSVEVDVAVLGAGITGLTAATLLKEAGKTVAVVDAKRVGRGVTGYTTAKVTSGHGAIYASIESNFGADGARTYADSNQSALEWIADRVAGESIDCDFERVPNYVYAETAEEAQALRDEAKSGQRAGLPASFVDETPLPFEVAGAVRLENQAQFHPRKYLLALAAALPGDGSHVFELTRALDVHRGEPHRVDTDRGEIRARDVIVATHIPFLDRGLFFAKAHPHRSYALTIPIDTDRAPEGMFINAGTPTRSIRVVVDRDRQLLLVGGEGHRPGEEPDTERPYRTLEEFARKEFGVDGEVTHRWSTQDYLSVDRVPYVGRVTRRSDHLLTATAYGKWGLTNGTVAAHILTDDVLGRPNPWASLYDAKRLKPKASAKKLVVENAKVARHLVGDRFGVANRDAVDALQPGEGVVVRAGLHHVAVSRADDGSLRRVSAACTHLGCLVAWNSAERSWDCPCHGSRFTPDGSVIQGPAVSDLDPA